MNEALLAISLLWGFIFIYAIMATMDFGAGFWSMVYIHQNKTNATNIANRFLSPTWEVTNVFIVMVVVSFFALFPGATYTLGTVLLIPGSIILLLLSVRSAFLVFSHIAKRYERVLTYISGITGFLIPAFLICVLPISQGNFIDLINGTERLNLLKVFTSPNVYSFIGLAISSTLFLSSLLLADYSKASNDLNAYKIYRRDALIVGPIVLLTAFLILFTIRSEAPWLYANIWKLKTWLIGSVLMFLLAGVALFLPTKKTIGMPRLAVVATVLQYFLASYAYGRAHLPYVIFPNVTIESAFTHPNTFRALFFSYIVGFVILFPGFVYFWKLFMQDRNYLKKKI